MIIILTLGIIYGTANVFILFLQSMVLIFNLIRGLVKFPYRVSCPQIYACLISMKLWLVHIQHKLFATKKMDCLKLLIQMKQHDNKGWIFGILVLLLD